MRWGDDLKRHAGLMWRQIAQDRTMGAIWGGLYPNIAMDRKQIQ